MLNAGKAYSERMLDPERATETFESLINRFPESELVPEALYNLYRINKEENSARSEATDNGCFRNILKANLPEFFQIRNIMKRKWPN